MTVLRDHRTIGWFLCMSVLLASGAALPAFGQAAPEQSRLRVGILPGEDLATMYIAKERGLFQQQGLNVEFAQFNAAPDILSTLVAGHVDIAVGGMTEVITAIEAGQPIRAFWTLTQAMPYEIWGRAEYADLKAAKGARFAISKHGAISDFFTRYAAQKAGLDPYRDIRVLQIGGVGQRVAALKGGSVDATILTRSGSAEVERAGFKRLAVLKESIPQFPFEVLYTQVRTLSEKPNTVRAILRALVAAIPVVDKADREVIEDVRKYAKFTPEAAQAAIDGVKGTFPADGRSDQDGVVAMIAFLKQAGEIKNDYKPEDLWDLRFTREFSKQ
jgi:NitT/TauT family transport system substrate-binding protein